jgi:phosphatidate cytidylyltransferase
MFAGLVVLVSLLGLHEFYRMALPHRKGASGAAAALGGFLPVLVLLSDRSLLTVGLVLLFLIFGLFFLFRIGKIETVAQEAGLLFFGFLYVPLLLSQFLLLRMQPYGIQWIFLLLVLVMSGDTAAYYAGSLFGRRKLYPEVSPKKTVEGSAGGLAGTIAGAFVARATFFPELSAADALLAALLCGPLGQLGDLFESLLKRSFGVKDSGTIIPGHGGILDRLDSVLFAVPALYWYSRYFFPCG